MDLRLPMVLMIFAATAVPIGFRPPSDISLELSSTDVLDMVENVVGYLPLGFVLAQRQALGAVVVAAALSLAAETAQFVMQFRDPSVIDFAMNVAGAGAGALIARWLKCPTAIPIVRPVAAASAIAAASVAIGVWSLRGEPPNDRGLTAPGILEGYWKLNEASGQVAQDSSGRGLEGRFNAVPAPAADPGARGTHFDGLARYVELGQPSALRLEGSMTITAWIRSTAFPADDAAIVSSHNGLGYQLDTTTDEGPRTISLKLGSACARPMARYGTTPLKLGTWYHVAGVYDALRQTIDVYLDGALDNGVLVGPVTRSQKSTRETVYIGRRSDSKDFGFIGDIAGVRIYSRALTRSEVQADMRDATVQADSPPGDRQALQAAPASSPPTAPQQEDCAVAADAEDARIPGAAATLGVLAGIAGAGFAPRRRRTFTVLSGLAAGAGLALGVSPTLPVSLQLLLAAVCTVGAACVAWSTREPMTTVTVASPLAD